MNKFLISCAVAFLAILASVQAVYKGVNVQDRTSIPWYAQVETIKNNGDELLCGGTIVRMWAILTTVYCLGDLVPSKTVSYVGYLNYKLGKIPSKLLIPSPNYTAATNEYNLGIIITQRRMVESPTIKPITLPIQGNAYSEINVQMYGMGMLGNSDISNLVRVANSKTMWNAFTEVYTYGSTYARATDMAIKKSFITNNTGTMCDGDEGGPLMVAGTSIQIGLFKYISSDLDCEVQPGTDAATLPYIVFERLTKHLSFVNNTVNANEVR